MWSLYSKYTESSLNIIILHPILWTLLTNFISADCILLSSLVIKSHFHFHKDE